MPVITQNIHRLLHLLELFHFSKRDLLSLLNKNRKKQLDEDSVFNSEVKVSTLNAVDKIFGKGLAYYVDPENPIRSEKESIFFRKENFNADLNLTAKQIVNKYEQEKISYETLLKLLDIRKDRILKNFSIKDDPLAVSEYARSLIYPTNNIKDDKAFLKQIIANMASFNILVWEHVERPRLNLKANIAGFYLSPDVIVIKWQKHIKREIFTLLHELGHYLLDKEDIDNFIEIDEPNQNQNSIENWCNNFAFGFLAGNRYYSIINELTEGSAENDYHHQLVNEISRQTHLSELAIYTRLLKIKKINTSSYYNISQNIMAEIEKKSLAESAILEQKKIEAEAKGIKIIIPPVKPIRSPLYLDTLQFALNSGFISEYEFCSKLNINDIGEFI
ncbi:ImmA/IrrE family metallo-endopeptidase [Mucilaginibacter sp. KACC 22063]|uniref:ImmA/IrrE family metallo-endopeptidase n=1 Tax=Mucilaginibacter sp. KACC 22063 TaxID=3025666 RepID=UPI00236677EC|nr:ImmA/IrrE family metallo-endopeptidase [Mucilaginibacter sp. KACC 22063]WDF56667.1 ImmA/IrrE family metallo-endopeptidase [Mucilaginibacter sp. KACC 22063]